MSSPKMTRMFGFFSLGIANSFQNLLYELPPLASNDSREDSIRPPWRSRNSPENEDPWTLSQGPMARVRAWPYPVIDGYSGVRRDVLSFRCSRRPAPGLSRSSLSKAPRSGVYGAT